MHKWEVLEKIKITQGLATIPDQPTVERMVVPGGWIYRLSTRAVNGAVERQHCVFVPGLV